MNLLYGPTILVPSFGMQLVCWDELSLKATVSRKTHDLMRAQVRMREVPSAQTKSLRKGGKNKPTKLEKKKKFTRKIDSYGYYRFCSQLSRKGSQEDA